MRHGHGLLCTADGVKFVGEFYRDEQHGVITLRRPSLTEEEDEDEDNEIWEDEVQQGLWRKGEFKEWISAPVNPIATEQFIQMFEYNEDEFNGVYALMVARRLPKAPDGVQASHPGVEKITDRIRKESGQLYAIDTIAETELAIEAIMPEVNAAVYEADVRQRALDEAAGVARRRATCATTFGSGC